MPYIQIHVVRGMRSKEELRKLANVIQECSLAHFNAPPKDRYQIITQHDSDELICEDTNLGLKRTDSLVFIQIFQQGRDAKTKQALYAALADRLKTDCNVEGHDLIITVSRNEKEDWSFGNGVAQFLTGDL